MVAPTPQPVAVPEPASCEKYRSIVAQYNWNVDIALQVMNAESTFGGIHCNPSADNPQDGHPTCDGSRGLFQIGCDSTDDYGDMLNAEKNIAQAYNLYKHRGWQPWSSTTCRYKVKCY